MIVFSNASADDALLEYFSVAKSSGGRILRTFLLLLVLLTAFVAVAPWLAGLAPVRNLVASRIGAVLGREVALEGIDAGWTSGVALRQMRISNPAVEFGNRDLLTIDSLSVDKPLHEILLGRGETRVAVEGMVLHLEEQGGRTNLDDILARVAKPKPPPKVPPEKPPEPRPFEIHLRDCTVHLQRTPHRPRPVDPFREDPEILAADAHAARIDLERFQLDVVMDTPRTNLRLAGGVRVNGKGGHVDAALLVDGGRISGEATVRGLDLSLLGPLVGEEVAGAIDLKARAFWESGASHEAAVDARLRRLRVPGRKVAEEWIGLSVSVRRDERGYGVERLQMTSASGDIHLEGTGSIPGAESAHAARFHLEGRAPARLFSERSGTVRILVQGSGAKDRIRFDRLLLQSPELNVSGSGSVETKPPHAGELSGDLRGDLESAYRVIRVLLPAAPKVGIEGVASLPELRLVRDGAGRLNVSAKGSVRGLVLSGVLETDLRKENVILDVDATWEDGRNRLTVSRGVIDELRIAGHVAGTPAKAVGTIQGDIELEPWMAGAAGLELKRLAGRLTIDAAAESGGNEMRIRGRATVEGLRADDITQKKVSVQGNLVRIGTTWSGNGSLETDAGSGSFDLRDLAEDRLALQTDVTIPDLRGLLTQVPDLALPAELTLAGSVQARVDLRRDRSAWLGTVSTLQSRLTLLWEERGVREEQVSVHGTFKHAKDRWQVEGLRLGVGAGALQLNPSTISLDPDGSYQARLRGWLRSRRLPEIHPGLQRFEPEGTIEFDLDIKRKGGLTIDGTLEGEPIRVTVDGKHLQAERLSLTAAAAQTANGWKAESFSLDVDGSRITGSASLSDRVEIEFAGDGDSAGLVQIVEGLTGSGAYELSGSLRAPKPGEQGPLELRCSFETAALNVSELDLRRPQAELTVKGVVREGEVEVITSRLDAKAEQVRHGSTQLSGCALGTTGEGRAGRIQLKTALTVDEIRCDQLPIHGVEVRALTELPRLSGDALRRTTSRGSLTFRSVTGRTITWQNGQAAFRLHEGVLELSDLTATANEGTVTCNGSLDLRTDPPAWNAKLRASDVRLSPELGRSLSHIVPILRLTGGKRSLIEGRFDADLVVQGRGTLAYHHQKYLRGKGSVGLRDVSLEGSHLLPLLRLRVDKALFGGTYEFKDLKVQLEVREGRVHPDPFELKGKPFPIRIEGSAGLDGSLDFLIRAGVLPVPMRVKGSWDDTKVRPAPLAGLR
ncbi:MAG: AsmA family protein [Planctomycetota bacterium]|jgi:hypothetical protein